jgi:hypothetical protein
MCINLRETGQAQRERDVITLYSVLVDITSQFALILKEEKV